MLFGFGPCWFELSVAYAPVGDPSDPTGLASHPQRRPARLLRSFSQPLRDGALQHKAEV